MKLDLADMAREVGADAVIGMRLWKAYVGWAWASPQGSGLAVKLEKPIDRDRVPGESL